MTEVTNSYGNYGYAVATANANRTPDRLAIRYRGNDYTFAEVNSGVNRTANALITLGVAPGDKVAVLLDDVMPIVDCYLALAKIGAVLVAINPYWSDEVMRTVLEHCEVDSFFVSAQQCDRVQSITASLSYRSSLIQADGIPADDTRVCMETALTGSSDSEPPLGAAGDDSLAFFFTSGTTGMPKPAVHSHNSCRSMAEIWLALPKTEASMWGTGPIIWGIGFPCTMGASLFVGVPVVLEDDFGPAGFLRALGHSPISHMTVIPSFWIDLLAMEEAGTVDFSSLEAVLIGGEPLGSNLLAAIKERAPGARIFAFYGQTEAPYTCFGRLDDGSQSAASAGVPRPTCAAQILGPDGERIFGEVGELAVSGPHCTTQYYRLPEKTQESLKDGWFFSGDMAVQDSDGVISVLGRREDAIDRAGKFVQPLTIEDAALGIDGVVEAGAVGVATSSGKQGILLAVRCSGTMDEAGIAQALQARLPPEAVPDRVLIVEELPHGEDNSGGKGKLLRREIRRLYEHLLLNP